MSDANVKLVQSLYDAFKRGDIETVVKGLPMTYGKDLQEAHEALFDSAATVRGALRAVLTKTIDEAPAGAVPAADSSSVPSSARAPRPPKVLRL